MATASRGSSTSTPTATCRPTRARRAPPAAPASTIPSCSAASASWPGAAMPTIRPLASDDRPLVDAALRSDGTFRDDEVVVAMELIDASLAGDPSYLVRAAEGDGRVAGYICFGQTPMTAGTWDLYWVVTHAQARGRGVAGTLIEAMEAEIRARGATA